MELGTIKTYVFFVFEKNGDGMDGVGVFNRVFSKNIDIIGVMHDEIQRDVEKKLKTLVKDNKILLLKEGIAYQEEPYKHGTYGIEDEHDLVSNYAHILMAHRKTCSFLKNKEKLRPLQQMVAFPDCPVDFKQAFEKVEKGQLDSIGYYTCAIFQLFMDAQAEADKSRPLPTVIGKVREYLKENNKTEYAVLCTFEIEIFNETDKQYFKKNSYESKIYPTACLAFFEDNKESFDLILSVIALHLSDAIREEFSAVEEITNYEGLSEEKISCFFENPGATEFAEDVATGLRNLVFADSLNKIVHKDNNIDDFCLIVGNRHVAGLNELLQRARIFKSVVTYNAIEKKLPDYLNS